MVRFLPDDSFDNARYMDVLLDKIQAERRLSDVVDPEDE
jgi:ribosome-binding factor A